jgi:hypothetical protein
VDELIDEKDVVLELASDRHTVLVSHPDGSSIELTPRGSSMEVRIRQRDRKRPPLVFRLYHRDDAIDLVGLTLPTRPGEEPHAKSDDGDGADAVVRGKLVH